VLILIEWRINAATGVRQPCLTELIAFGPDPLSDTRRGNAEAALQLPLPPASTQAIAGVHGAGVFSAPFPAWTRLVGGMDAAQQPVTITLPATLLYLQGHVLRTVRSLTFLETPWVQKSISN
jgi:hypothetical protein